MALKKDFEINGSGITASYIRVEDMIMSRVNDSVQISCGIYLSKEARDAGKNPINIMNINIKISELEGDIISTLYKEIKRLPELDGAEDV